MAIVERRIAELGIVLPGQLIMPAANRVSAVLAGEMHYLSGHGSV